MNYKEYKDFLSTFCDTDFLEVNVKRTFRINTLKISKSEFFEVSELDCEKSFYEFGFYTNDDIGRTYEYFLGYIHPQSLSSMLPSLILSPSEKDSVIDVAASPGSKTTHLAMLMNNNGIIYANDWSYDKLSILFSNIVRLGVINTKLGVRDAKNLNIYNFFTKAIVDVPCSALSKKSAYKRFNINISKKLSVIQKKILLNAYYSLKPGGELVYSTCTYSPYENEEVVSYLLEKTKARILPIDKFFPCSEGILDYGKEMKNCVRVYPNHFYSEGFFMAKIKKGYDEI